MFHYLWEKFTIWKYSSLVRRIIKLGRQLAELPDEQLQQRINNRKSQLNTLGRGTTLTVVSSSTLVEIYAFIREVIFRKTGLKLFPTQLFGGLVLHHGNIAQMNTGEGKTLAALLPVCLNALLGNTVYVVTVNEYLASRDWQISKPVLDFFSVPSAVNLASFTRSEKKETHENNRVIYTTGNQLGFDYLKNNLIRERSEKISLRFDYVIIDEVDSILIDESKNPLIISRGSSERGGSEAEKYLMAFELAKSLKVGTDYTVERKEGVIYLTKKGVAQAEKFYAIKNLFAFTNHLQNFLLFNALRAIELYRRGVEYIVDSKTKKVVIIDNFTGRLAPGRVYGLGIHQAIEIKEGLVFTPRSKPIATITYQNFFRLFKKIAGMTGTAKSESEEFRQVYGMEVVVVRPHKPSVRRDNNDLIFLNKRSKYEAIIRLIRENYRGNQRPVLVGSPSLETSQQLSKLLKLLRIEHSRLNAVNHREEAAVIKKAGEVGQLTISTNMAGRGTDIILTQESIQRGGLLLIGLERNLIRRIDDQLKGRAGRQGNPGTTQFYVSLEDELLKNYALQEKIEKLVGSRQLGRLANKHFSHRIFSILISEPQETIRNLNSGVRKYTLGYDIIINKQRKLIYAYRESVVDSENLPSLLLGRSLEASDLPAELERVFFHFHRRLKQEVLDKIDNFWATYLESLEKLRSTIGFRVYSFQDPQGAYLLESNRLFRENYLNTQQENRKITEKLMKNFSFFRRLLGKEGGEKPPGGGKPLGI